MFNRRQGNPRTLHNLDGTAAGGGGRGGGNWRNRDHNAGWRENVRGQGTPPRPYVAPGVAGFDTMYDRQTMFGEPQRNFGHMNRLLDADVAAEFRRYRNASTSSDTSYERRNNNNNQRPWRGRNNDQRHSRDPNNHQRNFRNSTESLNNGEPSERQYHPRFFGFKALETLLEKDPEKLLMELSNGKKGIADYIKNKLTDDGIVLFIKILKKAIESPFDDLKSKVLQTYLDDTFISRLITYLVQLSIPSRENMRKNQYFWKNPDDFWNNLIIICQDIYDTIPTFARKILPIVLKQLLNCFPSFESEHKRHISDEIKDNVTKLNEAIQELVKDYEEKEKKNAEKKLAREEDEGEPPDDFRQISLYPNSYELLSVNHGFLRRNVVDGPYKDVNHYLDVQFRLLREDFVGPLRTGISSYRSEEKKRIENVKMYKKVRFLNPETVNEQYCIRLLFDSSKKKKSFKYENSRRFMFGSLLCFTADNFKSIFFGKVAKRDVVDLEKGELVVGFDENTAVSYNIDYLMVECSVYFEPYYHVLNVLQTMNVENFPMERYIINVEKNVEPPEYLPNQSYKLNGYNFFPLINWPNVNFYNLNDSQSRAFKAALTQEFCIIQGPPGTGKTFLGLKIAKTLLQNKQVWYKNTPMLVICYTNHALDQFLEGITEFTDNILRVGGQSKNEKLKTFNLRNRSRYKMSPALLQQRSEVQNIMGKIKGITDNLKAIEQYDSVRAFDVFEDVVPHFRNSWFSKAKQRDVLEWLLSGAEIGGGYHEEEEIIRNLKNVHIGGEEIANDSEESSDDEDNQVDENSTMEPQFDDLFEEVNVMGVQCSTSLITLKSLETTILALRMTVDDLRQNQTPTVEEIIEERERSHELQKSQAQYEYLNFRLVQAKQTARMITKPPTNTDLNNPHNMSHDDRWHLYFYWLNLYKEKLHEKLDALNVKFRDEYKVYEQMRDIENTNSMKDVLVVGMTTTGAARLRSTIQALRSPIVIVEEAAEVLEAHIITSLTRHCKHLILIGDHQQLKPSTANFQVERFFNLGISLFERMVINEIQLYTLNVQHRMRPEISSLIAPTIYPDLEDHPTVEERPLITGLDHCLYFINHKHKEAECEGTSKKNYHEAGFLIHFAKHLILNGYKPENITILAAYLGQMFEMQKEKKKHKHILENVRIAVLDNYQGEECDIILLSLVRNNKENKIGFLSIENRVCVALSRARNGFYIMGNMDQLCAVSELWQKIRRTLDEQNAIGTKLSLRCQVHLDTVTEVEQVDDFLKISEGGCSQTCGAALVCGHKCSSLCHILDRDHKGYKCRQPCSKLLCDTNPIHLCKKMCYQECGPCKYPVERKLPCGHTVNLECHIDADTYNCHIPVSTTLPCGHVADKPCYIDARIYRCPHPCDVKVEPCGHACVLTCHVRNDPDHLEYKCRKKCARYRTGCTLQIETHICRKFCYEECEPCEVTVRKKRTFCPHLDNVACNFNVDEIKCQKPCTKELPCGHKCKNKCHEPCGKCIIKVEKTNPICGHRIKVRCCDEPDRKLCTKKCPLQLLCGHPCTTKCNEPCTKECQVKVKVALRSPCGHTITEISCCIATNAARQTSDTLLKLCNEPCRDQLKCEHRCSGTCGTCHQGRVHQRCNEKCGFPLVCNHPCEFPCRQACRPCSKPCPYKCKHGKRVISCKKKCGDVCTPCKEKCPRSCQHQKCSKFCSDICDVPPCQEPCEKNLKCGHKCVGFCGDPCPPKCLVCDREELTVIFFGFEEEEDARFVLLEDCGHIFESQGLDHWMQQDDGQIRFKECPQCKTPIKTTQRYSDLIKNAMADVAKVKSGFHGSPEEVSARRNTLQQKLEEVQLKYEGVLRVYCSSIDKVLTNIEKRLRPDRGGRRQAINKSELSSIESKLQIVEHVINICANTTINVLEVSENAFLKQAKFIMGILDRDEDAITDQEIDDIQLELNRLTRIIEYDKIKNSSNFRNIFSINATVKRLVMQINELLLGTGKFFDLDEQQIMKWLKELSKLIASGIGISDQERRDIVKAIGLTQGHWYKCPKGHPYAIGECGGAMQEAKCPECGAKIGGRNHQLVSDNRVATEMDGATHAAWSEAANMGNYGFQIRF